MNRVLIVIDAQEDFVRGTLRNEEAIKALPTLQKVVQYAVTNEMDIHYTMDTHQEDEYDETQEGRKLPIKHCIEFTEGWDICEEAYSNVSPYNIHYKDAFGTLAWESYLKIFEDVDEFWLCGFCTDICVSANFQILKACFPEIPIIVIADACAGTTPEMHEAALKVMKSCQAEVKNWNELNT